MVCRADPSSHTDEGTRDGVSNPHTEPRLPPRKTIGNLSRAYHPCVLRRLSTTSLNNAARAFPHTILNESAIQKPTKFQGPHWRSSGSTAWVMSFMIAHSLMLKPYLALDHGSSTSIGSLSIQARFQPPASSQSVQTCCRSLSP